MNLRCSQPRLLAALSASVLFEVGVAAGAQGPDSDAMNTNDYYESQKSLCIWHWSSEVSTPGAQCADRQQQRKPVDTLILPRLKR